MWAIVPVLLIIWLVGLLASRTGGGLLHILPLMAAVLAAVLISRRTGIFHPREREEQDG